MDFKEFSVELRKANAPRQSKIRNSWGIYDAYKLIRKEGWYNIGRPLKEHEFYSIIRGINKLLADEIASGNEIVFPEKMGKLEVRKFKPGAEFINGKLNVTYSINWMETMKLWFEDEEAKNNKTLLREKSQWTYYIKYNRYNCFYENRAFYNFAVNRFIKQTFSKNIKKGKIETLW